MIDKIIITADFLRTHYEQVKESLMLEYYLKKITNVPIYIVGNGINRELYGDNYVCVDVEKIYSYYNCIIYKKDLRQYQEWSVIAVNTSYNKECYEYLYEIFKNSFVITHDLCPMLKTFFEYYDIQYLDKTLNGIRFLEDTLIGLTSNNKEIYNQLIKYRLNEEYCYFMANYIKSHNNYLYNVDNVKPNSVLLCLQKHYDKSLFDTENNNIYRILEHKTRFYKAVEGFSNIYIRKHISNTNMCKNIEQQETKFFNSLGKNIIYTNKNFYRLISSPNLKKVVAISSSCLVEARYFGKQTEALLKTTENNFTNEFRKDEYIPVYGDYWSINFWADILSPLIPTNKIENDVNFDSQKNKLRNFNFGYWGYEDYDKLYTLSKMPVNSTITKHLSFFSYTKTKEKTTIYFLFIPVFKIRYYTRDKKTWELFGVLPLLRRKFYSGNKFKYYLFSCLLILKKKNKPNKKVKYYLFGFIPFMILKSK